MVDPNEITRYEADIQVNGATIGSVIDGMESFGNLGLIILAEFGLADLEKSTSTWYSQELWLKAFNRIADVVGDEALFKIGQKIPENAEFPPNMKGIVNGLRSIDVAYHINHMNVKGEILYDDNRDPKMLSGIGNYILVEDKVTDHSAIMRCQNPYPCDFDRGIILTIARKFASPQAEVTHMQGSCRKLGHDTCNYFVKW